MRRDVFVDDVLAKCDALKRAGAWCAEPTVRPRAWLHNFDDPDRAVAAILLDRFTFYSDALVNRLLIESYRSLCDGLSKGPNAPDAATLVSSVTSAVFTRVQGEEPRPTDSGNLFCRKARALLRISDEAFVEPAAALDLAVNQARPIVFLDDFIGSGDQFVSTWRYRHRPASPRSFEEAHALNPFPAVYLTLVATAAGQARIHSQCSEVAVNAIHVLDDTSKVTNLRRHPSQPTIDTAASVAALLSKYGSRLNLPSYMKQDPSWRELGYKSGGLLVAFEHSVPDLTLPIFWASGTGNWQPLVERPC
ncbi:phosphoribosyltransferase-like protein [Luteitalea sp.]